MEIDQFSKATNIQRQISLKNDEIDVINKMKKAVKSTSTHTEFFRQDILIKLNPQYSFKISDPEFLGRIFNEALIPLMKDLDALKKQFKEL